MSLSTVWLSLHRFSQDSQLLDRFLWEFSARCFFFYYEKDMKHGTCHIRCNVKCYFHYIGFHATDNYSTLKTLEPRLLVHLTLNLTVVCAEICHVWKELAAAHVYEHVEKFGMTSLWVLILYVLSAVCSSTAILSAVCSSTAILSAVCSSTAILRLCCNSAYSFGHLKQYTSEIDLFSWTGVGKVSTTVWELSCELERIQEQVGQPLLLSIWLVAQYCVTWWAAGKTDRSAVTRTPCIQYNRWLAVSAGSVLVTKLLGAGFFLKSQ
jgi:hypothetical protein